MIREFRTNATALKQWAKAAALVAPKRATLPILGNVKISARDGALTVTATDLDTTYVENWHLDKGIDFTALVNAKDLYAFSRTLNDKPGAPMVLLAATGTSEAPLLEVSQGDLKRTFMCAPVEDYPDMTDYVQEYVVRVTSDAANALVAACPYADHTSTSSVLGAVNVTVTEDLNATIVATDGSRLYAKRVNVLEDSPALTVNLPADAVETWSKICPETRMTTLSTGTLHGRRVAQLRNGGTCLITKLIDDEYPRYQELFPSDRSGYRQYDRKQFIAACKAAVACDKRLNKLVIVGLQVGSNAGDFRADLVGASSDNRAMQVNANYLRQWAESQTTDRVTIELTGSVPTGKNGDRYQKPLMLADEKGAQILLMPLSAYRYPNPRGLDEIDPLPTWAASICAPIGENSPREIKAPEVVKPAPAKARPAKRIASVTPAPAPAVAEPVTVQACKHLRKLIKDHQLTCRDCKCLVESLAK